MPSSSSGFRSDLARPRQLVDADWLCASITQRAAAPSSDWQVFEVGCGGLADYTSGHVPGARYLDSHQFEQLPFWNALPMAAFVAWLQSLSITPGSTVILYGRNILAAARLAHLLLVAGVEDVRLLDGGLNAWAAAGHVLEQGVPVVRVAAVDTATWAQPGSVTASARPDYMRHTAEVQAHLKNQDATLVSIRSHAEFMGQTSGYTYIARSGEIPGALWGRAGVDGDVNGMQSLQTMDGRMLPAQRITRIWREAGIGPEQDVVFYCGTGWRASLAFFYAWLMGWPRISVYDGGWFEWSSDMANPVVCRTAAKVG